MARYHLSAANQSAICKAASDDACTLGGRHFRTQDEADFYLDMLPAGAKLHQAVETHVSAVETTALPVSKDLPVTPYAGSSDLDLLGGYLRTSRRIESKFTSRSLAGITAQLAREDAALTF